MLSNETARDFSAFLDTLTVAQAKAWNASSEQGLFTTDLLTQHGWKRSNFAIDAVDARFECLLCII